MRAMRMLLVLVAVSGLVGLAGCSGEPGLPVPTPVGTPAGTPAAPALVLDNQASGTTVTAKVGQVVSLQLRSRRWSTPKVDTSIMAIQPLNVAVPEGLYRWDFKAAAPGTTTLTTEGDCPLNPGGITCNSVMQYKVTITVTP